MHHVQNLHLYTWPFCRYNHFRIVSTYLGTAYIYVKLYICARASVSTTSRHIWTSPCRSSKFVEKCEQNLEIITHAGNRTTLPKLLSKILRKTKKCKNVDCRFFAFFAFVCLCLPLFAFVACFLPCFAFVSHLLSFFVFFWRATACVYRFLSFK